MTDEPSQSGPEMLPDLQPDERLLEDLRVVIARREAARAQRPDRSDILRLGQFGRYEVRELLGEGGMARVYRAIDSDNGIEVALKVLKPELNAAQEVRARFELEVRTMSRVRHPNVVRIFDTPSDQGVAGIAMELLSGGSLRDLLRKAASSGRRLGIAAVTRFASQAAAGLGAAHNVSIVHRDVNPANLMLAADGTLKVVDFGVVLALERATWLTGLGRPIGTPAYMSPEQCRGERVDARSDVYSLGVTLFELLTGRLPFIEEAESPFALMLKHIREPAPDPRRFRKTVPSWLADVVEKCLKKNPPDRFETGDALVQALQSGPGGAARPKIDTPIQSAGATRINTVAIREQLLHLPLRAIVAWACRCARRAIALTGDQRLERSIALVEVGLAQDSGDEPHTLSPALLRIRELRTSMLAEVHRDDATDASSPSSYVALAAAAASACAAARCCADAAADAAFAAQNALTAFHLAGETGPAFWKSAQDDYRRLLAARLGEPGTIGTPIPAGFWSPRERGSRSG